MSKRAAKEQRKHPRVGLAPSMIRAQLEQDDGEREGYLINVSLGGAFLSIPEPPASEETSSFRLLLPWGVGECAVKAKTVWHQKDDEDRPIGAGLSFVDLSDDAKTKLENYLERFVELSTSIT